MSNSIGAPSFESLHRNPAFCIQFIKACIGYNPMKLFYKKMRLLGCIFLILLISLPINTIYNQYCTPQKKFDTFKTSLMHDLYDSDSLSIQFAFLDKSDFLDSNLSFLPNFDQSAYETNPFPSYLKQLKKINPEKLTQTDQLLYENLISYCMLHNQDYAYLYFENPLKPTGGMQTQLPILLAQFPIHERADIECFLSILEGIPSYFDSLVDYMQIRSSRGITTATGDMDETILQCDALKGPAGKALFYDSFALLLSEDSLELSMQEKERFLNRCDSILDSYVLPAYEKLADDLYVLKEETIARKGLCKQNASSYYELLIKEKTGTSKSLPQIEKMLKNRFIELYPEWEAECALLSSIDLKALEFELPSDPATILLTLQDLMQDHYPLLSQDIAYEVKDVPNMLSAYTAPAYYFTPHVDYVQENAIYVNHPDMTTRADLFTTLAHEGYPGHMLQATTFFKNNANSSIDKALYQAFSNTGYVEGWAFYTELNAYDYLSTSDCVKNETKAHYFHALQLQRELQICLYCMLDIRVHVYGDEAAALIPYLNRLGLGTMELAENLFVYLINEPATYASYYVGYLELLQVKKEYISYCDQTGRPFVEKEFHNFFLKQGPISYQQIRANLRKYFSDGLLHFQSDCVIIPFGQIRRHL